MQGFVICPKCGQKLTFEVADDSFDESPVGLIPITIIHGYPDAHALVVYVDKSGANRGYEIIENLVDLRSSFNAKEIIKIIGIDYVSKILAGIAGGFNLYIKADTETLKILHILLSQILKNEFLRIVSDERFADFRIDFITRKTSKIPGEKFFKKIIENSMRLSSESVTNFLSIQVSRIRAKFSELERMLQKREHPMKEILSILNIEKDEFKLFKKWLEIKNSKLANKILYSALDVL